MGRPLLAHAAGAAGEAATIMATTDKQLERDQSFLDDHLDEWLSSHLGEFVVLRDGNVLGFYPSYESAYLAALSTYGAQSGFLLAPIVRPRPQSLSISWDAGLLGG
jgi:hypothetical protein